VQNLFGGIGALVSIICDESFNILSVSLENACSRPKMGVLAVKV